MDGTEVQVTQYHEDSDDDDNISGEGQGHSKDPHKVGHPRNPSGHHSAARLQNKVIIRNIPAETSSSALITFLESKRHTGGTDVSDCTMLKGTKAVVTFASPSGKLS